MTTVTTGKWKPPIPMWIIVVLVLIIALGALIVYLGAGNVVNGLGVVAQLIFVVPLEWGAANIYNAMTVVLGIVLGTAIAMFLYTRRRYLVGQKVTMLQQPYQPQSQLSTPQLYSQTPTTPPIEVEEKKQ